MKLDHLQCHAAASPNKAAELLNQSMRFGDIAISQVELAKELIRFVKLSLLPIWRCCNTKKNFDESESVGETSSLAV